MMYSSKSNNLSLSSVQLHNTKSFLFWGFVSFLNIKNGPKATAGLSWGDQDSREASWMCVARLCVLCVSGGVKIRVCPCEAYN